MDSAIANITDSVINYLVGYITDSIKIPSFEFEKEVWIGNFRLLMRVNQNGN